MNYKQDILVVQNIDGWNHHEQYEYTRNKYRKIGNYSQN